MMMEKKRHWTTLSILFFAFLLLMGSWSAAKAERIPKGKLISAISGDVGSLDPMISTGGGQWPALYIGTQQGLIETNSETYEYEPRLSESWKISEDGKVWEFKLRKGIRFHNGEPFNAQAVKFSIDRMLGWGEYDPKLKPKFKPRYRGIWKRLFERMEVVDDYTVRIYMKKKTAEMFVRMGAALPMVPPKYIREIGDEEYGRKPVYTGCWKITDRKIGESITLTANADYWNKNPKRGQLGVPYIKTVVQRLIPEDETRISALRVGEVDVIVNVPPHRAPALKKEGNIELKYQMVNAPIYIGINVALDKDPKTGKPNPWRDIRLRKAISYAINRDELVKHILTGQEPLHYMLTPGQLGFDQEIARKYIPPYDPEKARKLVKEAGYPNGIDAVLNAASGRLPMTKEVTDALSGYLTAVGIRTKISVVEYRVISSKIRSNELYPLDFFLAAPGPEPLFMLRGAMSSTNAWGLHKGDPVIDKYINQAFAEFDAQKRADIYQKLYAYFAENVVYFVPLYCSVDITGLRSDRWTWDLTRYGRYPQYHLFKAK